MLSRQTDRVNAAQQALAIVTNQPTWVGCAATKHHANITCIPGVAKY